MVTEPENFRFILRILNTNIDGRRKVPFALRSIKGCGLRFSSLVLKRAGVDLTKRAGELTDAEIEKIVRIIQNPESYSIPTWFLNRRKDVHEGTTTQVVANWLDGKLREDLERLKKISAHRGLRHWWGLRVRGQRTCTTGRKGKTMGVSKKRAP